ncbi:MAG TPA: TetR/AcrR family transcriptional regulator [Polyangia bacterium]|jgi:AcrR family transcriptional regulator|nr:TetR/AcrR family transcriptional regulator [Polyangia bacterium]
MAGRAKPELSSRKQPKQTRSAQMVADILEASIRVLRREGGARFTTIRVAEEAGISVGSLYQYFPNKSALLFRLQVEEWETTFAMLQRILEDRSVPTVERLRRTIFAFFQSEREEAELRRALDDASAVFRGAVEARAHFEHDRRRLLAFFVEALPKRTAVEQAFCAEFFILSLGAIAEKVTDQTLLNADLERWTATTADLLCSYLERLQKRPRDKKTKAPPAPL